MKTEEVRRQKWKIGNRILWRWLIFVYRFWVNTVLPFNCGAYVVSVSSNFCSCAFICRYIAYPGCRRTSLPGVIDIEPFRGKVKEFLLGFQAPLNFHHSNLSHLSITPSHFRPFSPSFWQQDIQSINDLMTYDCAPSPYRPVRLFVRTFSKSPILIFSLSHPLQLTRSQAPSL